MPSPEQAFTDSQLLHELAPTAGELLNRHIEKSKPWYPHEFIPYDQGQTYEPGWTQDVSPVSKAVGSALYVNLLTEDNLPYYFNDIDRMFGSHPVWAEWNGQWTAEEGRHSIAIREYIHNTRLLDPRKLEDGRMHQVKHGEVPHPPTVMHGLIYVTFQELATRIAHWNTGQLLEKTDPAGHEVMKRVGTDENFHYLFYRGAATAAKELAPSQFVVALDEVVSNFEMPGTGIPSYIHHAARIAMAGIYGVTEFSDKVVRPMLEQQWKVAAMEGLTPEAEQARDHVFSFLEGLKPHIEKEKARRERHKATLAA